MSPYLFPCELFRTIFCHKASRKSLGTATDGAGEQEDPGQGEEGEERGGEEPRRFCQVPMLLIY